MQPSERTSGFKYFYPKLFPEPTEVCIHKLGIREVMPSCFIERPRGKGDALIMLFHDPACASSHPGESLLYEPETMMIWPPGKGQFYGNRERDYCHSWVHCSGSRIDRILEQSGLPVLRPFAVPNPSAFEQCLLSIHGEMVAYTRPDEVIIGHYLEICFREISRMREGEKQTARIPENLLTVQRWIDTKSSHRITLAEMAAMAGMSVSHFTWLFKQHFGMPPMKYLLQHRMLHAAHLLANRSLSISEICEQVGYDDLFHFSKMFKKQFGMSPRKMRGV